MSDHQGRLHDRTHLFVAAGLNSKAGSCPVNLRNISPTGALIEGVGVPEQGDGLILKRGSLEVSASVVWKVGHKAGIAFSSPIQVADWMARQPNAHQGRVDDIIRTIRSGTGNWPDDVREREDEAPHRLLEAELRALRNNLAELDKGLVGDVVLMATHPEVQLLDIALQSVERLLKIVQR